MKRLRETPVQSQQAVAIPALKWQSHVMANRKKKLSPEKMREFIHSLRGSIKFDTGGKSFTEWMADLNREEKELEERKIQRFLAFGRKKS